MNPLKKLASEAGLYGLPSILGRLLNYLLVTLHTAVFIPEQFGSIGQLYAYAAFLNIIYTYGMETAYFRFTTKEKSENYYESAFSSILLTSIIFSGGIFILAEEIIEILELSVETYIVRYLAVIFFVDAIVAIPLAKLRLAHKAKKFAVTRMSSIVFSILFNLLFLVLFPFLAKAGIMDWDTQKPYDIGYVFLANLLGNASMVLILYKEIFFSRIRLDWTKTKRMLIYAYPILLMGLAGMAVDQLDKVIFEYLLPSNFYTDTTAKAALGIYFATFKLSVFMALAIQAFRYAGEPFFFSQAEDKKAPELFAKVLYYFVALCLLIWVGVSLNADLIGRIFLRGEAYREALFLVPILLLGKLFFGIYINLSIWFKITDKTYYGVYISLVGGGVALFGNILLIPVLGYTGAALTSVLAYFSMMIYCYFAGQRHFYIPYPTGKIFLNVLIAGTLITVFFYLKPTSNIWNYTLGIVISLLYAGLMFLYERKRIFSDKLK
ncbi:Membrane protein involved in the export of O-antigen and teichoic acid [Marivirga sericea]|uniref:Membrane protein involved in the export of O-antigen and teichoic acid n=1 Tax=Marivirga sericea TaxID=1028 RepID=A0A1X7JZF8_9BACT|nr:polysaccharide biosynthesis C-terminal domain-containing protein [Marivirga sericea]SMG33974.1 Membrane protein involved in the export of O-antigen and teichoic acid [Marivirga sericea]